MKTQNVLSDKHLKSYFLCIVSREMMCDFTSRYIEANAGHHSAICNGSRSKTPLRMLRELKTVMPSENRAYVGRSKVKKACNIPVRRPKYEGEQSEHCQNAENW